MENEEFKVLVERARKRVHEMDKTDGFKDRYISTIWAALGAGIKNPKSESHFDAYVMLEEIMKFMNSIRDHNEAFAMLYEKFHLR